MGRANNSPGVKKGAWSKEEDDLLKKCVQQFGEGRWHLVPLRAGLNRCRKSCRMRWMNYLRPDITRGNFAQAEIDLLIRLHKLIGNRWSLIAGRIPGRTANDIKNLWNSRFEKKQREEKGQPIQETITKTNIIRPRPFYPNLMIPDEPAIALATDHNRESYNPDNNKKLQTSSSSNGSLPSSSPGANKCTISWWRNLLDATEEKLESHNLFLDEDQGRKKTGLWTGQINLPGLMNGLAGDFDFEV